jgi:hypothetical protein
MSFLRRWARRPLTWVIAGVLVACGGAVGLAVFEPWKLFVDENVNESVPVAGSPDTEAKPTPDATGTPAAPSGLLASGTFVSQEHETKGTVQILDVGNGRRVLRLENLNTSNGPDLHVWLTDAAVSSGVAGWKVFDDGKYVALGKLKGNKGSQNYDIPPDVKLDAYRSVSIWCDRFNVSFGAAVLR